jgi:hypothetical protein
MDVDLSDELIRALLDLIGPHVPYFIHLFFSQLGQLPLGKRRSLNRKSLEDV